MNNTPAGFVEMKNVTAVFMGDDEIVILGTPDEEVNDLHNCDDMGCSSVEHVIFRAKFIDGTARIG
jgi:hypothetical protein